MQILSTIFLFLTINLIIVHQTQGKTKNREKRQTNIYEFMRSMVDPNFAHLSNQRIIVNINLPKSRTVYNINFPAQNLQICNCEKLKEIQNRNDCFCPPERCTNKTVCVPKEDCIEGFIKPFIYAFAEFKYNELCEEKNKICCSLPDLIDEYIDMVFNVEHPSNDDRKMEEKITSRSRPDDENPKKIEDDKPKSFVLLFEEDKETSELNPFLSNGTFKIDAPEFQIPSIPRF